MRERKYVKFRVDMYEDTKFKIIDMEEERDVIHYIWNRLVLLAGKVNLNGEIYLSKNIPYTIETLAIEFNRNESKVKLALDLFIKLEMIEVINNVYIVKNFAKHQNIKIKEKEAEINNSHKELNLNPSEKEINNIAFENNIGKHENNIVNHENKVINFENNIEQFASNIEGIKSKVTDQLLKDENDKTSDLDYVEDKNKEETTDIKNTNTQNTEIQVITNTDQVKTKKQYRKKKKSKKEDIYEIPVVEDGFSYEDVSTFSFGDTSLKIGEESLMEISFT